MEERRKINHSWFYEHLHEVLEILGNIAAVAVFVGVTYLILHFLLK